MDRQTKSENRVSSDIDREDKRRGEIQELQKAPDCQEICSCQSEEHSGTIRMVSERAASEMELSCQCSHRTKERSPREYKDLLNRLNRIEGQVRGIRGMLERDAYCADILVQVSAVNAALNSFNKVLLSNHIHTCVAEDIRKGNDAAIDELTELLKKLMK